MSTHGKIDAAKARTGGFHRFIQVPLCCQETKYTCGVACVQSFLKCYGMDYRQDVLARELNTKPILGTDFQAIIRFMEKRGFEAYFVEGLKVRDIVSYINNGITPLLILQAWPDDPVSYETDWADNHYVIACGYSEDRIYFMDPYTLANYAYIPNKELPERWHAVDENGRHYYGGGLIINTGKPYVYDPYAMIYLE